MCSHTSRNIALIVEEMYYTKLSETHVESLFCCCFLFLFDVLVVVVVMVSLTLACQQALRPLWRRGGKRKSVPESLPAGYLNPVWRLESCHR